MNKIKSNSVPLLQQMLCLNVLDTFAGDAFPKKRNRERFVKFIDEVLDWDYKKRVCTPRLKKRLEKNKSISNSLNQHLEETFPNDGRSKDITDDCGVDDLKELAACGCERKAIEECRFPHVIWDYRNSILHQFEIPSDAFEVSSRTSNLPYYLKVSCQSSDGIDNRDLVLPTEFFFSICELGLQKFMDCLRSKNKNPYDARK